MTPSVRVLALLATLALTGAATPAAHADTAFDEMSACSRLGPKPPGSAAGRAQADRIATAFRAAGLSTSYEDFHVPTYVVDHVDLAVTGSGARDVPGETFSYAASGRVQAEVVDVGIGRPADYAGKDVSGKIVMVRRDEAFHRTSQLDQIIAHDGAAMLYVSGSPNNLIQTGTARFAQLVPAPIPAVTVGADEGARLREQLADGLQMSIDVKASRQDATARNVIGVRRGTTYPDKIVVVGGHYDNWHGGAIDNCTGIGSMLSVAEAVASTPLAYTVIFAAWDAEEVGLTGSYDWVKRHPELVADVVVDENLEMTAADAGATALRIGTSSPTMNAIIAQAGAANGYTPADVPVGYVRSISGGIIPMDLQPFYSAGAQGFTTFTSTPWYHTAQDLPEHVDPGSLTRVSNYLRDALIGLQAAPPSALQKREVPSVTVNVPERAAAGAEVPVDIAVADPAGHPITGVPVRVVVSQNDHWALAQAFATELGNGRYRYTIPAGLTDGDRTTITATVDQPAYIAEGYAAVDQTQGGMITSQPEPCTSQQRIGLGVRAPQGAGAITALSATITAGRARVYGNRVRVDLRGAADTPATLRLTARTSDGQTLSQSRQLRRCVTPGALANAQGGA